VYFNILGRKCTLKEISSRFARSIRPKLVQVEPLDMIARETASVAVIIKGRPKHGDQVLLIKRAERTGDPWSGQVAFPGGRVEAGDSTFADTAIRETVEEVGVDLRIKAEFLGYMGPFEPRNKRIQVVPAIFGLEGIVRVRTSSEVFSHRWIPIAELISMKNRSEQAMMVGSDHVTMPTFKFGDYLVWGLTERILAKLVEIEEGTRLHP
jgi:8-oxo-dGTP pyrophosphatase MutT (NUDIX family)